MRCQRQILDVCWWAHVSNAEVLKRSRLSTVGDILRYRRYGDLRSPGATEWLNGSLGLRDDDDDDEG